jgi:hypothetical protein
MQAVKGMVQVDGVTYRIVRTAASQYDVIRVLDDARVGAFRSAPSLELLASTIEPALLREVARMAIQRAKTSWVGRLALA